MEALTAPAVSPVCMAAPLPPPPILCMRPGAGLISQIARVYRKMARLGRGRPKACGYETQTNRKFVQNHTACRQRKPQNRQSVRCLEYRACSHFDRREFRQATTQSSYFRPQIRDCRPCCVKLRRLCVQSVGDSQNRVAPTQIQSNASC